MIEYLVACPLCVGNPVFCSTFTKVGKVGKVD